MYGEWNDELKHCQGKAKSPAESLCRGLVLPDKICEKPERPLPEDALKNGGAQRKGTLIVS
jgi:hypothetical protein